jgi:hypothetical protein
MSPFEEKKYEGTGMDSNVANWLQTEAKIKLQGAMKKLNLDNTTLNGKHLAAY